MVTLSDMLLAWNKAIKHNRNSKEVIEFEKNLEINLMKMTREINDKTIELAPSFAFVVSRPKYREVFGTRLKNRILHHLLDLKLRPIYEQVLSDRTFNNRKGKGLTHAIETFEKDIEDWKTVTDDVWLIHLDLKGYFPNADVDIAVKQHIDLIDTYYNDKDKEEIKYLVEKCLKADPARNCKLYGKEDWVNIPKEKSLLYKPIGTGAAIGFLCWQNAMGLYINHVIKWLQSFKFLKVVVFVDDIFISTINKVKTLKLIPKLRRKLAKVKVRLNENKFYCQHYSKGIMCLGTMLKRNRKYIKNTNFENIIKRIRQLRKCKPETQLASMNSYSGMFKDKQQFHRLSKVITKVNTFLSNLKWSATRKCFQLIGDYNAYCY